MTWQEATKSSDSSKVELDFSKEVIQSLSKSEAERLLPGASDAERQEKADEITKRMVSLEANRDHILCCIHFTADASNVSDFARLCHMMQNLS